MLCVSWFSLYTHTHVDVAQRDTSPANCQEVALHSAVDRRKWATRYSFGFKTGDVRFLTSKTSQASGSSACPAALRLFLAVERGKGLAALNHSKVSLRPFEWKLMRQAVAEETHRAGERKHCIPSHTPHRPKERFKSTVLLYSPQAAPGLRSGHLS